MPIAPTIHFGQLCNSCGENPTYIRNQCRYCYFKVYNRTNRLEREASHFKSRLKNKFGLTVGQYESMLIEQDGRCALCRKLEKKRLAVDHDHDTGRVRGLICNDCNTKILPRADADPGFVKRLGKYLES